MFTKWSHQQLCVYPVGNEDQEFLFDVQQSLSGAADCDFMLKQSAGRGYTRHRWARYLTFAYAFMSIGGFSEEGSFDRVIPVQVNTHWIV